MQQVEQISIFLATPGDVLAERNYVEEVVAELNRTIARVFGMSLRVFRWEEDVYPAYGGDPQAIINAQVGEMYRYELFVGIIWNRVGTPTPRANSGTLEEFEIATQARARHGQPEIFFYFRDAGSELKTIEEIEQRRQVLEFRKEFEKNGLSQRYLTPEDFRDKLRVQLSNWIERRAKRTPHEDGKGRPETTLDGSSMVNGRVTDAGPAALDPLPRGVRGRGRWRSPRRRILARLRRQFDLSRQGQGIETAALIPLVNEAVTKSNRQWLIMGAVSLCTAIPAGGITDFFFLLRKELILPLVNLEVSAPLFLCLSPLLILGMHLWLMFTEYDLLQNLTRFKVSRSEVKAWFFATSLCRYFPADYGFPAGFVVQGLFWSVFFLVPVGVFLYLQICSLRFRDAIISRILVSCTVVDLLALGIFIVLGWMVKWSNQDFWWGGSRWKRSRSLLAPATYSVFLALFSISYAGLLDDPDFCVRSPEKFWKLPVRRYINLSSLTPAKEGAPEEMAAVELGGRDLRCADFSGAHLAKANFARATLWGASFGGADLQEAFLTETDLREADLHRAVLQEAHLNRADLTGASAFAANLVAADLTMAHLRLGDFREAELDYALLDSAKMELARFDEAGLDRVSFKGAATLGASFQHARLRGAEGLALQGVGLRRALVFGLNSCGAPVERFPGRIDLRDLDLTPVDWEPLWMNLRKRVSSPLGSETLQRVIVAPSAQRTGESACFSNISLPEMEPNRGRWVNTLKRQGILYADLPPEPFFEGWPPQSSLTEEEFLQDLAGALIERACDELSRKEGELGELNLRVLLDRRAEEVDEFGMILRSRLAMTSCPPPRSSGP